MAERTLNTRIKLRYASYAEWMASKVQLLKGEVAVCYVEANNEHVKNTAPTVLFKVGDGDHVFADLQWASARAADVYDWAKAENRPTYTKADVGLGNVLNVESYSKKEVDDKISEIQGALEADSNTTYRFDLSEGNKLSIYSKEIGQEESLVGTFAVDFTAIENAISQKADKTQLNNYYTKTQADETFLKSHQDISHLATKTYVNEELAKKADKSYVNEELAKKVDVETYNGKMQGLDNAISGINGSIEGINESIEGIEGSIEEINGSIQGINGSLATKAEKSYVDKELGKKADVSALDNYYNKTEVEGQVSGLSQRITENANAIEALTNGTSTEEIDSVMELVDYVNTHGTEVQGMKDSIKDNADAIDVIEAKPAMGILEADTANRNDAVSKEHVHENNGVLDEISSEKVAAWDAAETNAKGYADGLVSPVSQKVNTLEGNLATEKGRIDAIEGDYLKGADKTTLENAIATEKGRVDTLVNTTVPAIDNRVKALEEKPFDNYALKSEVQAVDEKVDGVDGRLAVVEGDYLKSTDRTALENAISTAVSGEKTRAEAAELALSNRVKNVEDNYLSSTDVIIWDCGGAE